MARDWKNEKDYDYTKNHTPELWAWEFLRRNPDYIRDWELTLAAWQNNKPKGVKTTWGQLFGSGCPTEIYQPETLSFNSARDKWGLYFDEIINPDVEKPSVEYPYSLFYTYGYYYDADDLNFLPDLKSTEVLVAIDLAKPIQQQLEHFKAVLEEDKNDLVAHTDLNIPSVKNKPIYWKDYIRILDAVEANADIKEIASVIFPNKNNTYPNYNGNKSITDSHAAAKRIRDENYRKILQRPSAWKKR